jgi:alkanesulfonate monooxygenase SsuD/methylene tetrahydromethanopterin reductase-like flavin-dependent oxidoreductase (luciferase family)
MPTRWVADDSRGVYVQPDRIHPVEYHGTQFDVRGVATLPAGPQGHPIVLHAGDSPDGRDFGARHADAMITLHSELAAGQKYYADVKARAAANGRHPDRLKVFLAATVVLGDTAQQAADRARHIRMPQVTGRQQFVGTPEQVAAEIDLHVQSDACDGFILAPHLTPHGLDEFVDRVVPLLQERGSLPTDYSGFTLREHLGL